MEIRLKFSSYIIDPASNEKNNDGVQRVFYDADNEDKLSNVCQWWIAGLVKHASAIAAFCAPTVNCYRVPHKKANWGIDERKVSFRVRNKTPATTYIENRIATGPANAYLVIASTVAAGLDGIKHQLTIPKKLDQNAPEIPRSLEEALVALERDEEMQTALGEEFVQYYVSAKRLSEIKHLAESDISNANDVEGICKEREMYMRFL